MAKKRGLGRGLESLLSNPSVDGLSKPSRAGLKQLPVTSLQPGRYQPRQTIDPDSLETLAQSIAAQGIIQPLVVRPIAPAQYEIIAGERRWRAAQQAGLNTVPALVREIEDEAAMALALIENIQRQDLNPLEEAQALGRLIDEFGMSHTACSQAIGRSRSSISNLLRLLELEQEVQQLVKTQRLAMGHARALLGAPQGQQLKLAQQVADKQLSVRETERLVKAAHTQTTSPKTPVVVPREFAQIEQRLNNVFGKKIKLKHGTGGRGRVILEYKSATELQTLIDKMHKI